MRSVGFLAEGFFEPRHVPLGRDAVFGVDADQPPQRLVAFEFGQTGFGMRMPQCDGKDDDAPQDMDGVVVASFAACAAERFEQGGVGEGGEEFADGFERGAVFEAVPGEQGFGVGNDHGDVPCQDAVGEADCPYYATDPRHVGSLVEKF